MRILMLSQNGDGLGLADKIAQAGHFVTVFIRNPSLVKAGVGLYGRVDSWRPVLRDVDFIMTDSAGFAQYAEVIKVVGVPTLGLNLVADFANQSPDNGLALLDRVGIKTAHIRTYIDPAEAASLVTSFPQHGVIVKFRTEYGTLPSVLCPDSNTLFWALSKTQNEPITSLYVQDFIHGDPITISAFFNGTYWVFPWFLIYHNNDKLIGKSGCVIQQHLVEDAIFQKTLARLSLFLRKTGYRGQVSIKCISSMNTLVAYSITMGFLWDSIEAMSDGIRDDLADTLLHIAQGAQDKLSITTGYLGCIRLGSSFQSRTPGLLADMPILGVCPENRKHIAMCHMYKTVVESGQELEGLYAYTGYGTVLKVTAIGRTIKELRNRMYRTVDNILYADKLYDPSIGDGIQEDIRNLELHEELANA